MAQLLSGTDSDVMAALLRDVRVSSTVYCRSDMGAPWGFGVRARDQAAFHAVASGRCWLEVEGEGESTRLQQGDLVLLPRGHMHWLRDDPASPAEWLEDLLASNPVDGGRTMTSGGDGERTVIVCGAFAIEGAGHHPVFEALPAVIHMSAGTAGELPWLRATLDLIVAEASAGGPGAAAVYERVSELMLAQAVRAALVELEGTDELELLRDRDIAPAVRAIHERPEHPWTLGELADTAAMSRSAFAARFRALTGDSPIRYVTRCRLARSAERLRTTDATLAELAAQAGYESEFSFSRAFKRAFGVAPGRYRTPS